MRAGAFLDALAMDHQVTVLVVPVAGGGGGARAADFTLRCAHRLAVLSLDDALDPLYSLGARQRDPGARLAALRQYPRPHLCRWATSPALRAATAAITADGAAEPPPFAVVVVLRSYLAPYAAPRAPRGVRTSALRRRPAGRPPRAPGGRTCRPGAGA